MAFEPTVGRNVSERPTVLLFDVDGTLIDSGGVGRWAMEEAFASVYGREEACLSFAFDGMTDYAIARQGILALGLEPLRHLLEQLIEIYLKFLEEALATGHLQLPSILPEMKEVVRRARDLGMAVGLGTGNVFRGARLKLESVHFFEDFVFGGFGNDSEIRSELIQIGARRGAAQLQMPLENCRIVVIGDTPHDVRAAQAIGAECIGVGTGRFSPEILMQAGATFAIPNFNHPTALKALLGE